MILPARRTGPLGARTAGVLAGILAQAAACDEPFADRGRGAGAPDAAGIDDPGATPPPGFGDATGAACPLLRFAWPAGLCSYEDDLGADGEPELVYTASYDSSGCMIRLAIDLGGNGTAELRHDFACDDQGRPLSEERCCGEGGVLLLRGTYDYDEDGRLQRLAYDSEADGTVDILHSFTYDSEGRLATWDWALARLGSVIRRETYGYDRFGNALMTEIDVLGDGVPEGSERYFYSADGREAVVLGYTDYELFEPERRSTHLHYDEECRLAKQEVDLGRDGTIDEALSFRYGCGGGVGE